MKNLIFSLIILFTFSNFSIENTNKSNDAYSLQLVGLECIKAEGYATADAIYFIIDGINWPKERIRMYSGDYKDLEGYTDYSFSSSISIELWDDDTWDSDDFLGRNTIQCKYDNDGVVRFTGDGANYKLYYKVK